MASSYLGIFIPSQNVAIKDSIGELWKNVSVKNMEVLFPGMAIFDLCLKHENPADFDAFKQDNPVLVQKLQALSKKHPELPIALIEEFEHGEVNSYQGIVYKAGDVLLNEMGDFNFVFARFRQAFEAKETDWWTFYESRLTSLTSFLKINQPNFNLFESCYEI